MTLKSVGTTTVWNDDEQTACFLMGEGTTPYRIAITRMAIEAFQPDLPPPHRGEALGIVEDNRPLLEEIARRKFDAGDFKTDHDGSVSKFVIRISADDL